MVDVTPFQPLRDLIYGFGGGVCRKVPILTQQRLKGFDRYGVNLPAILYSGPLQRNFRQ